MDNTELLHWGVKGMKWGVRRYQNKDGTMTSAGKKRYESEMAKLKSDKQTLSNQQKTKAKIDKLNAMKKDLEDKKKELQGPDKQTRQKTTTDSTKKSIKNMSEDELRSAINRMNLEKQYRDLMRGDAKVKTSKGREFALNVLENSGKNIAGQFATYVMGAAVNKAFEGIFNEQIVNPKKGQKGQKDK